MLIITIILILIIWYEQQILHNISWKLWKQNIFLDFHQAMLKKKYLIKGS